jgi:hypothetical protein
MGGQACVFYGAAEFSRDTDIALLADSNNLERLRAAMKELCAEVIAVPPLELDFLLRGHAIHFRCAHPEAVGMRVDAMSKMRGLPDFQALWSRRTTVQIDHDESYDLMSLPDLVQAKKTQRDKDWPMIRRLVEADYQRAGESPTPAQVRFWLLESRTPALLCDLVSRFPSIVREMQEDRILLRDLPIINESELERRLMLEEESERSADREYWKPLRQELETLRHARQNLPG